jgi:hypothetical protein
MREGLYRVGRSIGAVKRTSFSWLSSDTHPHFTTIAAFVSTSREQVIKLFGDVLLICDKMGLIGREMLAVDGCKLVSNASKEWSGTKGELSKKRQKDGAGGALLGGEAPGDGRQGRASFYGRARAKADRDATGEEKKAKGWLKQNEEKIGKSGEPRKSNLTDNESGKMKSSHGVIQGYDGVAAVDGKHQLIVHAEAFGQPQEHELLKPVI